MESKAQNTKKVGLFVTLGLIAILTSIFMLGGAKSIFKKFISFHVYLDSSQGVYPGAVVSLGGVVVGNVSTVDFLETENKLDLELLVDAQFQNKVTEGSTVEIRTQGALGDKFVYIKPGDRKNNVLAPDSLLPNAVSSDIMGVISERGSEAGQVFEIIKEVRILLQTMNNGNKPEKILNHLVSATENLNDISKDAKVLIADLKNQNGHELKNSLKKIENILTKIDTGEGTLGALINDPSLHEQLKALVGTSPRKKYMKSLIQETLQSQAK
jgi:phospholipid/cholesterol/gamma-HCH transport system substrate-binding protein